MPASPTQTQTLSVAYLPSTHSYLRVQPEVTSELKSRRDWKLCVSSNWRLVSPVNSGAYEFRLQPGENTIVVDALASLKEGERKEYAPPHMQFDFERFQLVVTLMDGAV